MKHEDPERVIEYMQKAPLPPSPALVAFATRMGRMFAEEGAETVGAEREKRCPMCGGEGSVARGVVCGGCRGTGGEPKHATCYNCIARKDCAYAWDPYNTDGDCMAEK